MKLSLCIHTASPDNFLTDQGIPSFYKALLANLNQQTLDDFELVYVDRHHQYHEDLVKSVDAKFPVKHVEVHPNHRYWADRNYCHISAAKNTGILHADGELVVTCDDAEFFPPDFLERYWHYWSTQQRLVQSLHKRYRSIRTIDGVPAINLEGDTFVDDARWNDPELKNQSFLLHDRGEWGYAGASFPLERALALNGFDEMFDSSKSLEDCDFGWRLQATGSKFVLDRNAWLAIVVHKNYRDVDSPLPPILYSEIVENYGIHLAKKQRSMHTANDYWISDDMMALIREKTIYHRHFDPFETGREELLNYWKNKPHFNLRQERQEMR